VNPNDPKKAEKEQTEKRTDPRHEQPEHADRAVAPPIEREHETCAGVLEEDEKRERGDES
jgi:hypothetical protein